MERERKIQQIKLEVMDLETRNIGCERLIDFLEKNSNKYLF